MYTTSLEPLPPTRDPNDAVLGRVHDPLWFLARQWQLAEFQGENATSPVISAVWHTRKAVTGFAADLSVVPAETLIESGPGDWWTLGRRIRLGALAAAAGLVVGDDDQLQDPPPPYHAFKGQPDGYRLWSKYRLEPPGLDADALRAIRTAFADVPADEPSSWQSDEFVYSLDDAFAVGGRTFDVRRHRGGPVDWFTVDARGQASPEPESLGFPAVPVRLDLPSLPRLSVWGIEEAAKDVSGAVPDASHTATSIMTSLFNARRDEWFEVPVPGRTGHVVRIHRILVVDSFGRRYDSADVVKWPGLPAPDGAGEHRHRPRRADVVKWPGLSAPGSLAGVPAPLDETWTLFRVEGCDLDELLLWQTAPMVLEGDVVERVQLGLDEQTNVIWAVERRLDAREIAQPPPRPPDNTLVPPPPSKLGKPLEYVYVPQEGALAHWIPYKVESLDDNYSAVLEQRRLADYTVIPARAHDAAQAQVLRSGSTHRIRISAVPQTGLELERRWKLARDAEGRPLLWIEHQRHPLRDAPARRLRFDIAEPTDAPAGP